MLNNIVFTFRSFANSKWRLLFDEISGVVFSEAANKALRRGLKEFIKEDWRKGFDEDSVKEQIIAIT